MMRSSTRPRQEAVSRFCIKIFVCVPCILLCWPWKLYVAANPSTVQSASLLQVADVSLAQLGSKQQLWQLPASFGGQRQIISCRTTA